MDKCKVIIGSVTESLKAQRLLLKFTIDSSVIKADSSVSQRGCTYGLEYDCKQGERIKRILYESGINVSKHLKGGNSL